MAENSRAICDLLKEPLAGDIFQLGDNEYLTVISVRAAEVRYLPRAVELSVFRDMPEVLSRTSLAMPHKTFRKWLATIAADRRRAARMSASQHDARLAASRRLGRTCMAILRRSSGVVPLVAIIAASDAMAGEQTTAFRIQDMDLRDPHMFATVIGCNDITDGGLFSLNANLQAAIQNDTDPADGFLDLSYILEFQPLDQSLATNTLAFGTTQCTAPLVSTTCSLAMTATSSDALLSEAQVCLVPIDSTVFGYVPVVTSASAPCFVAGAGAGIVSFNLAGVPIMLRDTQIAATFHNDPPAGLVNGLVRGFLTEADANATIIPLSLAVIGGKAVSSLFPGGNGNCSAHDDKDSNDGVSGWWVYLNFVAARVAIEPIFVDGFDG